MKRKNMTRNALVSSIISLLLCVTMLLGTTFAWFTDEVQTGMNTIAAGNLDVELYAGGAKVDSATKLFDDVTLWEPGAVVYENLQVANVGTLALKYQMTLNFGNENDLNGHKLSEVLKVAVIDKVESGASRATVLAAAKAAAAADQGVGTLSNFYLTGELEAGKSTDEKAIVIYWDANDNATDNLYNANNGQTTSDGEALHIEFGVNLQATQKMSESDSFGNDYDKFASILPKATVNDVSETYSTVNATTNAWGDTASALNLDFALQFLPNEDEEEAASSAYKYYNADYVIKADKAVPANSMALAGYYKVFCDNINEGNWVALTSDEDIPANTEIRLVETMGNGSIKVSYKDICQYGNDGTGFLCGATDLTGANAGTTITVELRLYETTSDPNNSSNTGTETGNYEVVGTYSYTFGSWEVSTMEDLQAAIENGATDIDANGANLGDFYYDVKFTDGTVLKNAKFTYFYGGCVNGTVTFENCEFVSDHSYSANFDSGNGDLIFNNCLFDGWNSFGTAVTNVEMNNCTFQKSYNYGVLRFYQNAQLNNCTFADSFEGVDTNVTGTTVKFTNCSGIDGKIYNNGDKVGIWIVDGEDVSKEVTSW